MNNCAMKGWISMGDSIGRSVSVFTEALRSYSTVSDGMATEVMAASGTQALSSQVTLASAFGPIGKGFLAAFHQAEASHIDGARRVSAAHSAMSQQSSGAAAAYENADESSAASSESLSREI